MRPEPPGCALASSTAEATENFIDSLLDARHARKGGPKERPAGRGQKVAVLRGCPECRRRSDIAQRESPVRVSGRSPDLRVDLVLETAPSRAYGTVVFGGFRLAYRCVGSAGFAFHYRMRTGFPFHLRGSDSPEAPETAGSLRARIGPRKPGGIEAVAPEKSRAESRRWSASASLVSRCGIPFNSYRWNNRA